MRDWGTGGDVSSGVPGAGEADAWREVLGLCPREQVAVVGGGGKSTLCLSLAKALGRSGKRVIATTTTRVRLEEAQSAPCVLFRAGTPLPSCRLKAHLKEAGHLFVAEELLNSGKVKGVSPETADALFQDAEVDYVIVEADGAAGRPVKAPAGHEPVIPSSATLVVAMMGLEALGLPISLDTVFRLELFAGITGLGRGDILTPTAAAALFLSPGGLFRGAPQGARRIAWLNKADRLQSAEAGNDLARRLIRSPHPSIERVVLGSIVGGVCRVLRKREGGGPAEWRAVRLRNP